MSQRVTTRWMGPLALVMISTALVACGATEPRPANGPDGEVCESASECPGDQTCRMGYCTRPSARIDGTRFQFIPPQSSGYSPQTSRDVSAGPEERLDFMLERNVTVEGSISYDGNSSVDGPSGPLTFERTNRGDTLFDVQTRVQEGSFQAMVLPGSYDLLFSPEDYPTRVWPDRSFNSNTTLDDLSVPIKNDLATIQGTVVFHPEGRPDDAEPSPVPSARVLGVSTDGHYTTTIDTTSTGDEESAQSEGHFVLRAIPGSGPYDLIINPGSETLLPKVRVPDAFEVDEDGGEQFLKDKTHLGTYPVPSSSEQPTVLSFELTPPVGASGAEIDWARTQIVARAHLDERGDGIDREFRRETTPGKEGDVELALLPARYTVWMYPPAEAPLATTKITVDLTTTEVPLVQFDDWNLKSRLRGRVVDNGGEPVAGTHLEFWPNGLPADKFRDRLKVTTQTDSDGEFSVLLEPRNHEVTVRPPSDSGLPRHRATIRKKPLMKEDKRAQIRLPEPVLLRGSVRGASGDRAEPIDGTSISATVSRDDERQLLGKATTDEEGRFYMIVPAPE